MQFIALIGLALIALFLYRAYVRETSKQNVRIDKIGESLWNSNMLLRRLEGKETISAPGGWAASADVLLFISQEIEFRKPKVIMEFGSGLSTLVMAYAVKDSDSRIYSIDHSSEYADMTQAALDRHGMSENVTIFRVDLEKITSDQILDNMNKLESMPCDVEVDFVFIDGPPCNAEPLARRAALQYSWSKLSENGVVVMDDADRSGEQRIVRELISNTIDAEVKYLRHEKGTAVIFRSNNRL